MASDQAPVATKDIEKSIERMLKRASGEKDQSVKRDGNVEVTVSQRVQRPHGQLIGADTITEPSRQIPVATSCDVLVVGSGPSGLSAAVSAARVQGTDVVLVERFG